MNPFEGVTSTLTDAIWVWAKMLIIFILLPGLAAGLICRYLIRLSGKIVEFFIILAGLAGLYYVVTHYEIVYDWLL